MMILRRVPDRAVLAGFLIFTALSLLLIYTVTHEIGHALAGLAFGQRLQEFDVRIWELNPHVTLVGDLSAGQRLIQIGAGGGLPLLLWGIFQALAPRRASVGLTLVRLLAALLVLNTLLPWVLIPILALWGLAPPRDDAAAFLSVSRLPPPALAALALTLYVGGWLLFLRTTPDLPRVWRVIRQPDPADLLAGTRAAALGLGGLATLAVALSVGATALAAAGAFSAPAPPPGYAQVSSVDLSAGPHQAAVVAEFTVERTGDLGLFFAIWRIDTSYLDFQLRGPGGSSAPLLHGEGYRAWANSSSWSLPLAPGTYQVLLTAAQSPGVVTIYTRLP